MFRPPYRAKGPTSSAAIWTKCGVWGGGLTKSGRGGSKKVRIGKKFRTFLPHHIVRELRQIALRRAEPPGVSLCVAVDSCPINVKIFVWAPSSTLIAQTLVSLYMLPRASEVHALNVIWKKNWLKEEPYQGQMPSICSTTAWQCMSSNLQAQAKQVSSTCQVSSMPLTGSVKQITIAWQS